MEIVEVKPGVFACLMANDTANAGFVVTERGVVVIDTLNTPARGRQLLSAIKTRTEKPALFVINTHHHYDHLFGNQAFDAPVVAHRDLSWQLDEAAARDLMPLSIAAWISEHPEDRWLADELQLVYPNVIFERGLVLDLPPKRMVLEHLGGHTLDTSIVDLPNDEVLFAGDLVFEGRVPFLRQAHIGDTIAALRRLEAMGFRTVIPGHGEPCNMTYVRRLREYVETLREAVRELIGKGWEKGDVVDSEQLPQWWTKDRPDLLRANLAHVYDELAEIR